MSDTTIPIAFRFGMTALNLSQARVVAGEETCDDRRHVTAATSSGITGKRRLIVEALGTARLTETIPADRALSVAIPRREISDVLQDSDATPELMLRVASRDAAEPATVSMSWRREELERLLSGTGGADVVLTFDRDELAQALGDVEAHGVRTRAAIFAVAAAGALGGSASLANAMPTSDSGPVVSPTSISTIDRTLTDASSGSGYAAAQASAADSIVTDASSGAGYAAAQPSAADSMVTDASSGAGYGAAQASAADSMVTDASSGAGYAVPSATDSMLTDVSSGSGYAAAADGSAADSIRTDASSTGGYGGVPSTGGSGAFIDLHQPSSADLLGGAFLLAIAGASFAARRVGTARPA
jgi:hypothetical protein